MKREMPSREEQDAVVWYVLKRPLVRPDTSYKKAALYISLFISINVGMIILLYCLFHWPGILSIMPQSLVTFSIAYPAVYIIALTIFQFTLGSMIAMKRAIIGAIRLYQRYAPEETRRKCLFKPTCSEYAILAIQKYGVIRGGMKAYDRLFHRCRGRIYRIDEP